MTEFTRCDVCGAERDSNLSHEEEPEFYNITRHMASEWQHGHVCPSCLPEDWEEAINSDDLTLADL